MNRRHAIVIGGIAAASVGIAVFLYYFFMSAWVYVDVATGNIVGIRPTALSSEDVSRHPVLQQKIREANEHWSNPEIVYGPMRTSFFEGKAMANTVGDSGFNLTGNNEVYFNYDEHDYRLIIVYRY